MVRARLAVVAGALASLAAAFVACANDDDDARTDAADGGDAEARESGAFDAGQPEPACDPDADLLAKVSDAAIADGASTTGVCLGCARARCPEEVADCTEECACQRIVSDAIGCYVTTQQITCAAELANVFVKPITRQYALSLVGCVKSACAVECAIDAGPDGDAAPADAAGDE